eukprot:136768-Ditylum_brightwellii.AAC.1
MDQSDMNAIMKVIWNWRLIPDAMGMDFVSLIQFGNKKGSTVFDTLFVKVITMDSMRLFHFNSSVLNNNAVACYGRIIPT